MDNPFSRHRRSESRRRAKDEPQKLRNFRGDLSGIEGLADLITQHILALLLLPARHGLVAGLCQKELGGHRGRVALISGYVFSALCLFGIFPVVQTVTDGLGYALALVGVALQ